MYRCTQIGRLSSLKYVVLILSHNLLTIDFHFEDLRIRSDSVKLHFPRKHPSDSQIFVASRTCRPNRNEPEGGHPEIDLIRISWEFVEYRFHVSSKFCSPTGLESETVDVPTWLFDSFYFAHVMRSANYSRECDFLRAALLTRSSVPEWFQGPDQKISNASSWSSLAQTGQVLGGSAVQPAPQTNLLKSSTDDSFLAFKKQAKEQAKKVSIHLRPHSAPLAKPRSHEKYGCLIAAFD